MTVRVEEFTAATGLDQAAVAALVKARLLVRARLGHLPQASVRSWVAGFRPELLDGPLLAPK